MILFKEILFRLHCTFSSPVVDAQFDKQIFPCDVQSQVSDSYWPWFVAATEYKATSDHLFYLCQNLCVSKSLSLGLKFAEHNLNLKLSRVGCKLLCTYQCQAEWRGVGGGGGQPTRIWLWRMILIGHHAFDLSISNRRRQASHLFLLILTIIFCPGVGILIIFFQKCHNPHHMPDPSSLGLDIDRCITVTKTCDKCEQAMWARLALDLSFHSAAVGLAILCSQHWILVNLSVLTVTSIWDWLRELPALTSTYMYKKNTDFAGISREFLRPVLLKNDW